MKRRTRRDTETFSMSFLDCICCGFGAIILLLVLNEFGEPIQLEKCKQDLDEQIVKMEKELFDIRGMSVVLERELRARIETALRGAAAPRAVARRPVDDRGQAQGEHRGGGCAQEADRDAGDGAPVADRRDAASCRSPAASRSTTSRSRACRSTANTSSSSSTPRAPCSRRTGATPSRSWTRC